jgi:hypothetical protein
VTVGRGAATARVVVGVEGGGAVVVDVEEGGALVERVVVLWPVVGVAAALVGTEEIVDELLHPATITTPTASTAKACRFTTVPDWSPLDSTRQ